MEKFKLFFTLLFLIMSLIIIVVIAVLDHMMFIHVLELIQSHLLPAAIITLILLILLTSGIVSNSSNYEGSLLTNGFILFAALELFLLSAGLVYLRYNYQQPGTIVLKFQTETKQQHISLSVRYNESGVSTLDTVTAPGVLADRPAGKYSFEILDPDIVYFRGELVLAPAEIETLRIPVVPNTKRLIVQSEPTGAEVWINGLQTTQTPDTFELLTGDTAIVELKMQGYEVYTDTVTLDDHIDLGIIPLRKLYTLWISSNYAYTEYFVYDVDGRIVFRGNGSRKIELPEGRYRIATEIGEGQKSIRSITLTYNQSIQIP